MSSLALFTDLPVPPSPFVAEEPDPLAAFEAWITSEDGRRFWRAFDALATRALRAGITHLGAWDCYCDARRAAGVKVDNNVVPLVTRLWMAVREAPGFFERRRVTLYSETEAAAMVARVSAALDGTREAA